MMPQLMTVRVHSGRRRPIRLWIPLLPVLIVLSPLLLVASLVLVAVCVVYRVNPARAFAAGWGLLWALNGLEVEVQEGRNEVRVTFT